MIAIKINRDKGIMSVRFTCSGGSTQQAVNGIELGILGGKYLITQWPNAMQRIYRNGSAKAQYLRPGSILNFGQGEQIRIEVLRLLSSYQIEMMPIFAGDVIAAPDSIFQWQRITGPENEIFAIPPQSSRTISFRSRLNGAGYIRIRSDITNTIDVRMGTECNNLEGGNEPQNFVWDYIDVTAGEGAIARMNYNMIPGEDYVVELHNYDLDTANLIVEIGASSSGLL